MFYEKIKIYVTKETYDTINKDAESFEFFKKDGVTLNKNAFLTRLVVNFNEEFIRGRRELIGFLEKTIKSAVNIEKDDLDELSQVLCEGVTRRKTADFSKKCDHLVSFKPTKETQPIVDYVEQYELAYTSLSEYFRNMFVEYSALPQDKREEIIFKSQRESILLAIKEGKKVYLSVNHDSKNGLKCAPYSIAPSKEELHCYLLCSDGRKCMPLRLSRISSVTVLSERAEFSDDDKTIFQKMIKHGVQFFCTGKEEQIVVRFTPRGLQKFRKVYFQRPTPVSVSGNEFTFDCSYNQAMMYFMRLGKDAYIVSPVKLRKDLERYYEESYEAYKNN